MSDIDTADPFGLLDMLHAPLGTMIVKVADTPFLMQGHWVQVNEGYKLVPVTAEGVSDE